MAAQETFRTESMNVAAALLAHGFEHLGSEHHGGGRGSVVFSVFIPPGRHDEAKAIIKKMSSEVAGLDGDLVLYEKFRGELRDTVRKLNGGTGDGKRRT